MDCLPWGQSHQQWHPLSAMWKAAASPCCCSSVNWWLMDRVSSLGRIESLSRTCVPRPVSVCRNVNLSLQSAKVTLLLREDYEAGQIQPADCWGKWESDQWLSFMISFGVIPHRMSLYQAIKFMECRAILNRQESSFHNLVQLRTKKTLLAASH